MSHGIAQKPQLAYLIQKWCGEALARWGDDWTRIAEYIQINFDALSSEEQSRLTNETTLTLLDPLPTNKVAH